MESSGPAVQESSPALRLILRIPKLLRQLSIGSRPGHTAGAGPSLAQRLVRAVFEDGAVPTIPPQAAPKPVILFDCKNLLYCEKFSFSNFNFITYRRAFCEEMLYNLVSHYELVSISEMPSARNFPLLAKLDPFGCISYRLSVGDKRAFLPCNLNRPLEKTVVVATAAGEYNEAFKDNTLLLPRWAGKGDAALLDLVHFFSNLYFMNPRDYRPTIRSYAGAGFFEKFRAVQCRLFKQRNLFSGGAFERKLQDVNAHKAKEYAGARLGMEQMRGQEPGKDRYAPLFKFLKSVVF
ncbi:mitochondrial import inner membrane translocase subunit TIM50 [Pancytospora philotis]|nr:mitochondrial import inner membrane translocase subunit TIM50 [Pancytospora philotis]